VVAALTLTVLGAGAALSISVAAGDARAGGTNAFAPQQTQPTQSTGQTAPAPKPTTVTAAPRAAAPKAAAPKAAAPRAAVPKAAAPRAAVPRAAAPSAGTTKAAPKVTATTPAAPQAKAAGSGQWRYASPAGPVVGTAGPLRTFRVAVESGLPVTLGQFTDLVDSTLGDPRSWIVGGDVRLQRVSNSAEHDFTIFLASPQTAYELCLTAGVDIRMDGAPYTSCRAGAKVVINSARYLEGVAEYGAPLDAYRRYVVNHEVGHWLGHDHVRCPGAGKPAPVMAQQTLGLQGCVANSWPYLNGERYTGPAAEH